MFNMYVEPLSPIERDVFKILDDPEVPESPNEGAWFEIYDESKSAKEGAC